MVVRIGRVGGRKMLLCSNNTDLGEEVQSPSEMPLEIKDWALSLSDSLK